MVDRLASSSPRWSKPPCFRGFSGCTWASQKARGFLFLDLVLFSFESASITVDLGFFFDFQKKKISSLVWFCFWCCLSIFLCCVCMSRVISRYLCSWVFDLVPLWFFYVWVCLWLYLGIFFWLSIQGVQVVSLRVFIVAVAVLGVLVSSLACSAKVCCV